ncbi:hypothetical protein BS50DRAFT_393742 [Corynespora cassiicola Philippines]|uniref:Uncharacterized protein n=1 Tax=Corynespora cassiicola Philippines TaxID=1448308 RepID=A0A2T2NQ81_CORCC|nr:hypothetical protein BS50DRAFT_393742 [Corynespora cassiicola Philippines]
MVHGPQLRQVSHDSSLRHRIHTARSFRDIRRRNPSSGSHIRDTQPQKREFGHRSNSFSLLAELDQTASQTKWAFDLIQGSHTGIRRRGKRGGKTRKTRVSGRNAQEGRKSESLGESCNQIATLHLDEDLEIGARQPEYILPKSDFTFVADSVGSSWKLQLRPNSESLALTSFGQPTSRTSLLEPRSTPTQTDLPPPPSYVELMDMKDRRPSYPSNESRFFPLSAFLNSPSSTDVRQPKTGAQQSGTKPPDKRQGRATSPSHAQASVACKGEQDLASEKPVPSPLTISLGESDTPGARSAAAPRGDHSHQRGNPPLREILLTLERDSAGSPMAPLPITPPLAAAPTISSLSAAPSILSTEPLAASEKIMLPSLSPRPAIFPHPGFGIAAAKPSPDALITAPVTSPYTLIPAPPRKAPAIQKQCVRNHLNKFVVPHPTSRKPVSFSDPFAMSGEVQSTIDEFMAMGHAKDCWCSAKRSKSLHTTKPQTCKFSAPESNTTVIGYEGGPASGPRAKCSILDATFLGMNIGTAPTNPLPPPPKGVPPCTQAPLSPPSLMDLEMKMDMPPPYALHTSDPGIHTPVALTRSAFSSTSSLSSYEDLGVGSPSAEDAASKGSDADWEDVETEAEAEEDGFVDCALALSPLRRYASLVSEGGVECATPNEHRAEDEDERACPDMDWALVSPPTPSSPVTPVRRPLPTSAPEGDERLGEGGTRYPTPPHTPTASRTFDGDAAGNKLDGKAEQDLEPKRRVGVWMNGMLL